MDILTLTQIIVNFILIAFNKGFKIRLNRIWIAWLMCVKSWSVFEKFIKVVKDPHAYIDICKLKSDRSLLSKFRLSAHSLAIEKGHYSNIERQNRVCLSCDTGEVENEYHFFSTCPHYISLRKTFLQNVNIKIVNSNISYFIYHH